MERTYSEEFARQHSMDIDTSPVASPSGSQLHTCSSGSPVSGSPISCNSPIEVAATTATAPKKCTCPYERPTLKTMEAAAAVAAAGGVTSAAAAITKSTTNEPNILQCLSAVAGAGEDSRNANQIRPSSMELEDNINNNHDKSSSSDRSNSVGLLLLVCDSEVTDVNSNKSITCKVNAGVDMASNQSSESSLVEAESETKRRCSETEQKSQKKSSSSKKKSPSSDKCSCSETVTVRVKAAESPPAQQQQQRSSFGRSSLNDGILSNCLSALNFVSGNRIGGGDSKFSSGTSSGAGVSGSGKSQRNSKSSKPSSG